MGFSIEPNDVDFFTTLDISTEDMGWLVGEMNELQNAFYVCAEKLPWRGKSKYKLNINDVWNFSVCYVDDDGNLSAAISPGIQLISINVAPHRNCNTPTDFAERVWERFDISICKCAILSPDMRDSYMDRSTWMDIVTMKMTYDMRAFRGVNTMMKRLKKYTDRGFSLRQIQLSDTEFFVAGNDDINLIDTANLRHHSIDIVEVSEEEDEASDESSL
jgi:hypothetical protein